MGCHVYFFKRQSAYSIGLNTQRRAVPMPGLHRTTVSLATATILPPILRGYLRCADVIQRAVFRSVPRQMLSMFKSSLRATALLALTIGAAGCSRSLPPTQTRLGSPVPHGKNLDRWGDAGAQRSNQIPNAFGRQTNPFLAGTDGTAANDTIYFSSDSIDLTPEARQTLTVQATWLNQHRDKAVSVEGHADERGTREYNVGLGVQRASAVKTFLITQGIEGARIRTTSFGKERPIASCPDISCWSQNRRSQTILAGGAAVATGRVPYTAPR
jgi:peptidoglycan-associated lipoprotein